MLHPCQTICGWCSVKKILEYTFFKQFLRSSLYYLCNFPAAALGADFYYCFRVAANVCSYEADQDSDFLVDSELTCFSHPAGVFLKKNTLLALKMHILHRYQVFIYCLADWAVFQTLFDCTFVSHS